MDNKCIFALGILTAGYLGLVAMFRNYKAKFERKGIILEKNDRQHNQRIGQLEEKNGHEQHQLDEHKKEINDLKKDKGELKDLVIKLQDRIINCEKNGNHKKRRQYLGEEEE